MKRVALPYIKNMSEPPIGNSQTTKINSKCPKQAQWPNKTRQESFTMHNARSAKNTYVGQKGEILSEYSHKYHLGMIRKLSENLLLSQHTDDLSHSFNWEAVDILD